MKKFLSSNRLLTAILLVGIIHRFIFFIHAYKVLPVSTDEALPGLMARHILDGEFPLVYWGQTYMGTLESFFQSIFIYLFGMIPFSVRVFPFLIGILFIIVTFKLADEIYGRSIALISLALVSIPTAYLSICSSLVPPDNYLAIVLIGSISLLLLHRAIYKPIDESLRLRYYCLIGLLSGIGFWIHLLYIDYIAVILLFIFIQDKFFVFRKRFWAFVFFFIIGALPLVIYNISHHLDTFTIAKGLSLWSAILNLPMLFRDVLPQLIGMKVPLYGDNWNTVSLPDYWGVILVAIYAIAFSCLIISRWKNILGFIMLSLKRIGPTEMLLAFVAISIVIFIRSDRSNSWAVRYILPIFSVVPILIAVAIYNIGKRYKALAAVMLSALLVIQLYGNGRLYAAWSSPDIVDKALDLPDDRPLISFLDSKGITRAYAYYWIADRLTYETSKRIICARPYDERFAGRYKQRYMNEVASSPNLAYILHERMGISPVVFEESMKKIGGRYSKEVINSYTVFYKFIAPYVEIPRTELTVTSNYNPRGAYLAIDGDIKTRWGTGHPQINGMTFEIEISRAYPLNRIKINLGGFTTDHAKDVDIEVSEDRIKWSKTNFVSQVEKDSLRWDKGQPRYFIGEGFIIISYVFEPVMARFIRIIQTGSDPVFDWSIPEISLFSTAGP